MGDVEATIDGTLEGAKDASTGGGAGQTDVEEAAEGAGSSGNVINGVLVTVNLGLSIVVLGQVQLGQNTPGEEQSGAVSCCVVCETDLNAISGQLVGIS